MTATGHQVREADLVDFAQVRMIDPLSLTVFDDFLDIEFPPANIRQRDFILVPIHAEAVRVVAHEIGSVRQFDDGAKQMETGYLIFKSNFAEAAQIDVIVLVLDGKSATGVALAGPEVSRLNGGRVVLDDPDAVIGVLPPIPSP